jgi:hypothetical protein
MFTSGSTSINPNHEAPDQDWAYAKIRFNVANFHSVSEPEKRGVIAHEMGHGMGLGHSTDSNAVMYNDWPQPEKPNSDDESGVRSIY